MLQVVVVILTLAVLIILAAADVIRQRRKEQEEQVVVYHCSWCHHRFLAQRVLDWHIQASHPEVWDLNWRDKKRVAQATYIAAAAVETSEEALPTETPEVPPEVPHRPSVVDRFNNIEIPDKDCSTLN